MKKQQLTKKQRKFTIAIPTQANKENESLTPNEIFKNNPQICKFLWNNKPKRTITPLKSTTEFKGISLRSKLSLFDGKQKRKIKAVESQLLSTEQIKIYLSDNFDEIFNHSNMEDTSYDSQQKEILLQLLIANATQQFLICSKHFSLDQLSKLEQENLLYNLASEEMLTILSEHADPHFNGRSESEEVILKRIIAMLSQIESLDSEEDGELVSDEEQASSPITHQATEDELANLDFSRFNML